MYAKMSVNQESFNRAGKSACTFSLVLTSYRIQKYLEIFWIFPFPMPETLATPASEPKSPFI